MLTMLLAMKKTRPMTRQYVIVLPNIHALTFDTDSLATRVDFSAIAAHTICFRMGDVWICI